MKKLLAILPLMTAVFLAPSCKVTIGWDTTEFTYKTDITGAEAKVTINWTSGAHLSFKQDKLEFIPDDDTIEIADIKCNASTVWPQTIAITFKEAPTENVKGLLNYTYTNNDTGASGDNQVELTFTVKENN